MTHSTLNLKYPIAPHMEQNDKRLFVPRIYGFDNKQEMISIITHHPLCHISTQIGDGLNMTSLPLVYRQCPTSGEAYLLGHIARRNPHLSRLQNGCDALCVFTGPSSYISPRWFIDKLTVPTWSYCSVQIRGTIQLLEDLEDIRNILQDSINEFEHRVSATASKPSETWSLDQADPDLVNTLLSGITGIRIPIQSISGVKRQMQDKSPKDRNAIAQGLINSRNLDARQVGLQIEQTLPTRGE